MTGPKPAITVEVLPAGYGDCLLVTCPVAGAPEHRPWRLLVDTGPDECWPTLRERLGQIPPQPDGTRTIDLLVISHTRTMKRWRASWLMVVVDPRSGSTTTWPRSATGSSVG